MKPATKLTLVGICAAGVTGVWLGYTKAAFFLRGVTAQQLVGLERQAKQAARREQAA